MNTSPARRQDVAKFGYAGTAALLLACLPALASATAITATAQNLGGSQWRYDYVVDNNTLGSPIQEFTVYFGVGLYQNIASVASPGGWDPLVADPDAEIPAPGFLDTATTGSGIAVNGSLAGFAVTFDYLGDGAPGAQAFDIVDPVSFATLESGTTSVVPLPGAAWLLLSGLASLGARGARRGRRG